MKKTVASLVALGVLGASPVVAQAATTEAVVAPAVDMGQVIVGNAGESIEFGDMIRLANYANAIESIENAMPVPHIFAEGVAAADETTARPTEVNIPITITLGAGVAEKLPEGTTATVQLHNAGAPVGSLHTVPYEELKTGKATIEVPASDAKQSNGAQFTLNMPSGAEDFAVVFNVQHIGVNKDAQIVGVTAVQATIVKIPTSAVHVQYVQVADATRPADTSKLTYTLHTKAGDQAGRAALPIGDEENYVFLQGKEQNVETSIHRMYFGYLNEGTTPEVAVTGLSQDWKAITSLNEEGTAYNVILTDLPKKVAEGEAAKDSPAYTDDKKTALDDALTQAGNAKTPEEIQAAKDAIDKALEDIKKAEEDQKNQDAAKKVAEYAKDPTDTTKKQQAETAVGELDKNNPKKAEFEKTNATTGKVGDAIEAAKKAVGDPTEENVTAADEAKQAAEDAIEADKVTYKDSPESQTNTKAQEDNLPEKADTPTTPTIHAGEQDIAVTVPGSNKPDYTGKVKIQVGDQTVELTDDDHDGVFTGRLPQPAGQNDPVVVTVTDGEKIPSRVETSVGEQQQTAKPSVDTATVTPKTETSTPVLTITAQVPEGDVTKVTIDGQDVLVGEGADQAKVQKGDGNTVTITVPNAGGYKDGASVTVTAQAAPKSPTTSDAGKVAVDRSGLTESLEGTNKVEPPKTAEDQAYNDAIDKANEIKDKSGATQDEVDAAKDALDKAKEDKAKKDAEDQKTQDAAEKVAEYAKNPTSEDKKKEAEEAVGKLDPQNPKKAEFEKTNATTGKVGDAIEAAKKAVGDPTEENITAADEAKKAAEDAIKEDEATYGSKEDDPDTLTGNREEQQKHVPEKAATPNPVSVSEGKQAIKVTFPDENKPSDSAVVKVKVGDDEVTLTKDEEGKYTGELPNPADKQTVPNIVVTDGNKIPSITPVTVGDKEVTDTPTITSANGTQKVGDTQPSKVTVVGTAEPNADITITYTDKTDGGDVQKTVKGKADADGNYTIDLPGTAKGGSTVSVVAQAPGENESESETGTITVDKTGLNESLKDQTKVPEPKTDEDTAYNNALDKANQVKEDPTASQDEVDKAKEALDKAKKEKDAKDAIEEAKKNPTKDNIDKAQDAINKVDDGTKKDGYNKELQDIRDNAPKQPTATDAELDRGKDGDLHYYTTVTATPDRDIIFTNEAGDVLKKDGTFIPKADYDKNPSTYDNDIFVARVPQGKTEVEVALPANPTVSGTQQGMVGGATYQAHEKVGTAISEGGNFTTPGAVSYTEYVAADQVYAGSPMIVVYAKEGAAITITTKDGDLKAVGKGEESPVFVNLTNPAQAGDVITVVAKDGEKQESNAVYIVVE